MCLFNRVVLICKFVDQELVENVAAFSLTRVFLLLLGCLQCAPSPQESFKTAVEEVKVLPVKPSNSDMGKLYGLYKQATVGDVNIGQSLSC